VFFVAGTANGPASLSCVNASTCYAGDGTSQYGYGQVDKLVNGRVTASVVVPKSRQKSLTFHSGSLTGISCPTIASCLAAGPTAFYNPGVNYYYTSATVSLGV
jgi:hypothetical protein